MAKRKNSTANVERRPVETVATLSMPVAESVADGKPEDVLHRVAEELGRLIAHRLGDRRQGYGLFEMLAGALVTALILLLLMRITSR